MKYKVPFDTRTKWLTPIILTIIIVIGNAIYLSSSGTFFPAWITVLAIAILLFMFLSIPTSIELSSSAIEIMCVVEITHIPYSEIRSIQAISKKEIKPCIPIIGVYALCGYYGYYFSFKTFNLMRFYVKRWDSLVMIQTIKDKKYIISVPNNTKFVTKVEKNKTKKS